MRRHRFYKVYILSSKKVLPFDDKDLCILTPASQCLIIKNTCFLAFVGNTLKGKLGCVQESTTLPLAAPIH